MIIYYTYVYEIKFSINLILKNKIKKIYSMKKGQKKTQINLTNPQNLRSELWDRDNTVNKIKKYKTKF